MTVLNAQSQLNKFNIERILLLHSSDMCSTFIVTILKIKRGELRAYMEFRPGNDSSCLDFLFMGSGKSQHIVLVI